MKKIYVALALFLILEGCIDRSETVRMEKGESKIICSENITYISEFKENDGLTRGVILVISGKQYPIYTEDDALIVGGVWGLELSDDFKILKIRHTIENSSMIVITYGCDKRIMY